MQKTDPKSKPESQYRRAIATNRRARHDYHILETFEAGIELQGSEVKSMRTQSVQFADCYARVYENECWLIGLQVKLYDKAHVQLPDPARRRKLLLHRSEIDRLRAKTERTGCTLVPLEIYFKGSKVKVLLGLGKGKTHADKRDTLRKADAKRDIARTLREKRARV